VIRHDSRRVSASARAIVTVLFIAIVTLAAPAARTTADLCGATIVEDLTLDQDLTCAAGGPIVGADGIKINLQGHSITGAGAGVGITVSGRTGVTIFGGTIGNFGTGVLTIGSTAVVIKDNLLRSNTDGVDVQAGSSDITIKANTFENNRTRGVMMRGGVSDVVVKDNTFTSNRVGVLVNGPTSSIVKANTISGSTLAAIRVGVTATDNLVLDNILTSNPVGIDFIPEGAVGAVGNSFIGNAIASNTCGIKGPYTENVFNENQFSGNTSDICA
jgi:parallel beta-helix repeat protein